MDMKERTAHAVTIHSLQKMIDFIEENITKSLTPASVAKHFYLSVSSVNILFRVVCDVSLMEYIRNRRLTLAGMELSKSNVRIIDLAYKYGYETPEAFAKAFSRFHGFPPSFVRRIDPVLKLYLPLQIKVERQGGWSGTLATGAPFENMTQAKSLGQEKDQAARYTDLTKSEGEIKMEATTKTHTILTKGMEQKDAWRILLALTKRLEAQGIPFKIDGKTVLFAHGFDYKLDKICLSFKWNDEQRVLDFFGHKGKADKSAQSAFWYFDAMFDTMKIRCMAYGDCQPQHNTDDFLYRNTDFVNADGQILRVQTVDFYLENAEPKDSEFYLTVSQWAKSQGKTE